MNYGHLDSRTWPVVQNAVELVFESVHDYTERSGQLFDGFFKAPADGEYRFYIACDDSCKLSIDATNPLSTGGPFSPVIIAQRYWWTSWRNYLDPPLPEDTNQYISAWITLTGGQLYKI